VSWEFISILSNKGNFIVEAVLSRQEQCDKFGSQKFMMLVDSLPLIPFWKNAHPLGRENALWFPVLMRSDANCSISGMPTVRQLEFQQRQNTFP